MKNMRLDIDARVTQPLPGGFGFKKWDVQGICDRPGQFHEILKDGEHVIGLFARDLFDWREIVGARDSYGVRNVSFGFRVFSDLTDARLVDLSPMDTLEALADRFGYGIRVLDNPSEKFIRSKTLPIHVGGDMTGILAVDQPEGDTSPFVNMFLPTTGNAEILVAFCLDMAKYKAWLDGHEAIRAD
jgi:hypothetical protein